MAKLDILITATNQASGPVNAAKKALQGLGSAAKATALAAGAAAATAVAGVTAAVVVGVGKAADMEQQVADIASIMGKTYEEAKPLKDLITQLGIDPGLKVDATEAADAIQMLARNGLSMTEILDGAARSTVLLANATNADFGTAADIATDVMSLFKISAEDMSKAVNGITSVTTNSKFAIDDYALALAQGGGVAAAAGVSFEDFNATIAAISPYFAGGSDAGTSFKVMLQRLVPASQSAESAMQALGLITADGANQFFDASGNMKSMEEVAGLLQGALSGLTEEQRNAALSTIFGTDAMRAAVALADVGAAGFSALAGSMAQVDAEAAAATRMDTFSGQLEILQGIIDGLLLQIGDAFLPSLRSLTEWAIAFVDAHGPAVLEWFSGLAGWLESGIPIFFEWSQKAVWAIGEVLNWLQGGDEQFVNLRQIWGQVTAIIADVIGQALAFVRENTPKWIATLLEWGGLFASWAGSLWATHLWPGLQQMWSEMSSWLTDPAKRQQIIDTLLDWWNLFASWSNNLWAGTLQPGLASAWQQIAAWLDENAGGIGTRIEEWVAAFVKLVSDISAGWLEAWPEIVRIVSDAATDIGADVDSIMESLGKLSAWAGDEGSDLKFSWADFWVTLADAIAFAVTRLVDNLATFLEALTLIGDGFQALGSGDWGRLLELDAQMRGLVDRLYETATPGRLMETMLRRASQAEGRALGGPVLAGVPYWVGEQGRELFVPQQDGRIVPHSETTNYNNWTVNLMGSGNARDDVLASMRLISTMYWN